MLEDQMKNFSNKLDDMDEDQLKMVLGLFPALIESMLAAGKITPARAEELRRLIASFDDAMALPLEERVAKMRAIMDELISLGAS